MTTKVMMELVNFDNRSIWVDVMQINTLWIDEADFVTCFTLIGDSEPFKVKTALTTILRNIPDRLEPKPTESETSLYDLMQEEEYP